MKNILTQKLIKDNIECTYDCIINSNDEISFVYSISKPIIDKQIQNIFYIDFPTLRIFMNFENKNYNLEKYSIQETNDFYILKNNIDGNQIVLFKNFLINSYLILEKLWEDD